ncbi:hypothetical protein NPIL_465981 [Nephila pilipes]|uniref:Uncharacterized protein n=1 Tax=Nephila pilipes TaxID=299642 RepID=A0A8X6PP25_NEPPI|nr:hypothetical protein NPIL_465981 [Nephila pilipes]
MTSTDLRDNIDRCDQSPDTNGTRYRGSSESHYPSVADVFSQLHKFKRLHFSQNPRSDGTNADHDLATITYGRVIHDRSRQPMKRMALELQPHSINAS